eukprot:6173309-Pleurochrysis_carterae.AAC.2
MRTGRGAFLLARAEKEAMNFRTCDGASDLLRMKWTDLKRVWSSTIRRYQCESSDRDVTLCSGGCRVGGASRWPRHTLHSRGDEPAQVPVARPR